jgi:hypothetical protein
MILLGNGEEAPLAGDTIGELARLRWRFSWSMARGDAAPAKAESEGEPAALDSALTSPWPLTAAAAPYYSSETPIR